MKRTLYLSMVCLLSAFSAVGQTGLRGLNPIEKQKLQLPELPASQSRVTLLRSSENVDYTQGVFILNEDWFGHNNSTINFMTSSALKIARCSFIFAYTFLLFFQKTG